jgi:hypothetical protein
MTPPENAVFFHVALPGNQTNVESPTPATNVPAGDARTMKADPPLAGNSTGVIHEPPAGL